MRLGNRDVAPVAALQSQPRECQSMSWFWPLGAPCKFGTRDFHPLLGVSKYVIREKGIFSLTSIALDLEARWR